MSEFITIVIEYKEGEPQPSLSANMDVLAGKVTGVMFGDALLKLEDAETQLEERDY